MAGDFTPVETRILDALGDFAPHAPAALVRCLADDLGPVANLWPHIKRLRAKLPASGLTIVTELHPAVRYRLAVLVPEGVR